ncbi:hypothetical protein [Streptomyces guryensis]|uniref:PH domain-containing protein n=1 Tax=Streptomyces guryensis TaxID=2886947 RepID=A0A9Q3VS96_9ACTN|nr:hypothetical protein [Streptomyces guryensis]MCD9876857.1 hypothetical protein [Streptomyces guryensis]
MTERDVRRQEYAARGLLSGEQLCRVFSAGLDPLAPEGVPRRHRPPRAPGSGTEDRSFRGLRVLLLPFHWMAVAGAVLTYPLEKLEDWFWGGFGIRRLVRGRVWHGGWESDAGRFVIAVRAGDGRGTFRNDGFLLTFTDRRVLLLSKPLSPERETPRLYGEYPRQVPCLRREPHPARHRNRVDLAFPDGSWVALAIGSRDQVDEVRQYLAASGPTPGFRS